MTSNNKKTIPAFIGVASVWMGTHFGPGFASGAQMNIYYVNYGLAGLFTPVIAMIILGVSLYFTMEYSRLNKLHNFKDYSSSLYSPFQKIMSPLFDFCYLFTVVCALGSCLAGIGSLLNSFLGIPYWVGIGFIIALIVLVCIFGSELVRVASSYMVFFIIGILLLIFILSFVYGDSDLAGSVANSAVNAKNPSLLAAIWSAVVYASFQATVICNICSVTDTLVSKKESKKATIAGIVGNLLMMTMSTILIFGYTNVFKVGSATLPFYSIMERLNMPWLTLVYVVLVILAVTSTGVGFIYSGITRYGKLFKIENTKVRDALISIILLTACACAASFGLTALVSKGFRVLGYLNLPIMILPALFVASHKITKNYRKAHGLFVEE